MTSRRRTLSPRGWRRVYLLVLGLLLLGALGVAQAGSAQTGLTLENFWVNQSDGSNLPDGPGGAPLLGHPDGEDLTIQWSGGTSETVNTGADRCEWWAADGSTPNRGATFGEDPTTESETGSQIGTESDCSGQTGVRTHVESWTNTDSFSAIETTALEMKAWIDNGGSTSSTQPTHPTGPFALDTRAPRLTNPADQDGDAITLVQDDFANNTADETDSLVWAPTSGPAPVSVDIADMTLQNGTDPLPPRLHYIPAHANFNPTEANASQKLSLVDDGGTPDEYEVNLTPIIDAKFSEGDFVEARFRADDAFRTNLTDGSNGNQVFGIGVDGTAPDLVDFRAPSATDKHTRIDGSTWISGTLDLETEVTDSLAGVEEVRFLRSSPGGSTTDSLRSTVNAELSSSPYSSTLSTTGSDWTNNVTYTFGTETLDRARNDNSTNRTLSTVTFGVDNVAPDITLETTPQEIGPDQDTLTWTVVDPGAGPENTSIRVTRQNTTGAFVPVPSQTRWVDDSTLQVKASPEISAEGTFQFNLSAADNLTQSDVLRSQVTRDFSPPTYTGFDVRLADGTSVRHEAHTSSPLMFNRSGRTWVAGQSLNYTAHVNDTGAGVDRVSFYEDGNPFRTQENVSGTSWRWERKRSIDGDPARAFRLNSSALDSIGNFGDNWRDGLGNLSLGFDRESPKVTISSSRAQFVGKPTINFTVTDQGSGVPTAVDQFTVERKLGEDGTYAVVENTTTAVSGTNVTVSHHPQQQVLDNGTYFFRVTAHDNLGHQAQAEFQVDVVDVNITGPTTFEQRDGLLTEINAMNNSRLEEVRFRFLDDGQAVSVVGSTSAWQDSATIDDDLPTNFFVYSKLAVLGPNPSGDVPLGTYKLEAEPVTPEGASATKRLPVDGQVRIAPKLTLDHAPGPNGTQPNGPWLEDGVLNASIWSAFHAEEGPNGPCRTTDFACQVSQVEVEGLFENSDGSTEWRDIRTIDFQTGTQPDAPWFNYTFEKELANPGAFQDQVRITSNVTLDGTTHSRTEKFLVEGPGAGIMNVIRPVEDDVNATGNISFAVELQSLPEETVSADDAVVELTVRDTVTGEVVVNASAMNGPSEGATGLWTLETEDVPDEDDEGLTADDLVPDGRYRASFALVNSTLPEDDPDREVADTGSSFAVERDDPTILHVETPWTNVDGTKWIGSTVPLNITVETDFARLTSLDDVTVAFNLEGPGWASSPNVTFENETVEEAETIDAGKASYRLVGQAAVPSTIGHEDRVGLSVNATSNVNRTADPGAGIGSNVEGVKLDAKAPNASAHRTFTPVLGTFTHNESLTQSTPTLRLNVTDEGAQLGDAAEPGVYEVTFFDQVGNESDPAFAPWTGSGFGDPGDEPEVFRLQPTAEAGVWVLPNDGNTSDLYSTITSTPLDRYFVNATAVDRAGNEANLTRLPVAADLGAPTVPEENLTQSDDGENFTHDPVSVRWGNAPSNPGVLTVRANVTEDTDLTAVEAILRKPNGDIATVPANLSAEAGECTSLNDVTLQCEWNVTGDALSRVGTYRLGILANDTVNNTGGTRNATDGSPFLLNFTVEDSIRPEIRSTSFDPDEIGPNSPVQAHVTAFDDGGIASAQATWINTTGAEEVRAATVNVTSCNPTDNSTDDPRTAKCTTTIDEAGIDLARNDTWRVDWRVRDEAGKTRNASSDEFTVQRAGSPFVERVNPPAGTTVIGAQVDLRLRIVESSGLQTPVNVTARIGGGNFSSYDDVSLSSGGNDTSFLAITPPSGSTGSTWDVRVNVTDVNGRSTEKSYSFTLDNAAPTVSVSFQATNSGGSKWVTPDTEFSVSASDTNAGVASRAYRVGSGGSFQSTNGTFTLPSGASGTKTITVRATDEAGNTATDEATVTIDSGPPSVTITSLARTVTAEVTDAGIGLDASAVKLFYRQGDSGQFSSTTMTSVGGNAWEASVPSNINGRICVYVEAADKVGFTGRDGSASNPQCFGAQNQAPTLQVTEPAPDTTVKGTLTVRWSASDPDGDNVSLSFSVVRSDGGGPPQSLDSGVENDGSATFDVSNLESGQYTLNVRATDGAQTARVTRTIFILTQDVVQETQLPGKKTNPQEEIRVEVQVSHPFKTVANVTGIVTRNGQVVEERPMQNPQGNKYVLTYTPTEPGSFNVTVRVTYQDNTSQTYKVAGFDVAGAVDEGLAAQLVALVVLGAVVVGMGGYGAFGRWNP